ncbi:hypothetical protein ACFL3V_02580 [Nanoarchaeota archaeon]
MGVDDIVLGIVGIGVTGSLGMTLAKAAGDSALVSQVYLSEKQKYAKLEGSVVRDSMTGSAREKYLIPKTGIIENDMRIISDACDMIFFCFGRGLGVSREKLKSVPPDARQRMFDANIDLAVDYGRIFGELESKSTLVMCSNPVDELAFFFNEAYIRARNALPEPGQIIGMNHVDNMRFRQLVRDELKKREVFPDDLQVVVYGPHDPRMFPVLSQCSALVGGERKRLDELKGVTREVLQDIAVKAKRRPFGLFEDLGSTSDNTVNAILEMIRAAGNRRDVCTVSYPVPDYPGDAQVFMGLPSIFRGQGALPVMEYIESLDDTEKEEYRRTVRACSDTLEHLALRQGKIRAYLRSKGSDTGIADTPRYFKELVVPIKEEDGQDWLHFFNFTYPFEDFSEVRDPIPVSDRVLYMKNIDVEGRPMIATCNVGSLAIIDPTDPGGVRQYRSGSRRVRLNGCCTLDDHIFASSRKEGLLQARGDRLESVLPNMPPGFSGHVQAEGGHLFYAEGTRIVENVLDGNQPSEVASYSTGLKIRQFRVFRDAAGISMVATAKPGEILRFRQGSGAYSHRIDKDVAQDVNFIDVQYVFGGTHTVYSEGNRLVLREMEEQGIVSPVSADMKIYSFRSDMLGGMVVLASERGGHPRSQVYRKARASGNDLSRLDLAPVSSAKGVVNDILIYSEFGE